jgi:signal transduction histidine kinase
MSYIEDYENRPIRVLHVEDDAADTELIVGLFEDSALAIEWLRADDEAGVLAAMREFRPDIVLSDLSMPGFSGYRALEIVREHSRYVPFIFVSGTMGEETAVKALRQGATDYIIKNNPARLVPAVERALREARDQLVKDRTEAELLRSQRLDSLALLAGGLSHDLRNILQPLLMVAPMIADRTEDERLRRLGELVEDCAKRGLDMVASMLSFARGARQSIGQVRLQQLLRALDLLLQGTVPRSVRLEIDEVPADLGFEGNDTELQQCLLNLCLNAIQAMPDGGVLKLSAEIAEVNTPIDLGDLSLPPDTYLRITVTDTGVGMTDEVQRRLFTPFFTTKKDGTGLGLLSCKRIVTNHRGGLRLVSAPGKGTRFEIYLPTQSINGRDLMGSESAIVDARILVVGEEAGSLSLLGDGLALKGYRASIAQGGAAAIHQIEQRGLPDLVVLDADMRLLSSVRTLMQLQEREYRGPVLLLVDGDNIPTPDELPDSLCTEFVRKPVALPELLDAVHRALVKGRSQAAQA